MRASFNHCVVALHPNMSTSLTWSHQLTCTGSNVWRVLCSSAPVKDWVWKFYLSVFAAAAAAAAPFSPVGGLGCLKNHQVKK